MKDHETIKEQLPEYINGNLAAEQTARVKAHLESCAECREEVALWEDLAGVIEADYQSILPPDTVLPHALERIRQKADGANLLQRTWLVIRTQAPLVRKEIWPSSLLILLLGFVVTLIADKAAFIYALAPLVSAAALSFIYGGENDPVHELVLSTPVSQVQILLARSVLVFGYNFLVTAALSLGLSLHYSTEIILPLALEWLAPMTFLSTLGLSISVVSNSGNAIFISYFLWLGRYLLLTSTFQQLAGQFGEAVLVFWQTPAALYLISACLLVAALYSAQNSHRISQKLA